MRGGWLVLGLVACGSPPAPVAPPPATPIVPPPAAPVGVDYTPRGERNPAMMEPSLAKEAAPAVFKVKFTTTEGDFVVEAHRDWAPNGADRFYNLVKIGYFDGVSFFRAIENFMVQFGIHGDPAVNGHWRDSNIQDDPVVKSNTRGFVTFAMAGTPNSRSTQIFINYVDKNAQLDGMGFAPFGQVVEGMDVVDKLYKGYGEGAPGGRGPDQGRVQFEGNPYLNQAYPELDSVKSATILP